MMSPIVAPILSTGVVGVEDRGGALAIGGGEGVALRGRGGALFTGHEGGGR